MAESTIKIYSSFVAMPSKNMVIENFATCIGSLTPWKTITKNQYIKQQLNVNIKVDLSQDYLEMDASNVADLNYVSILNENDDMTYYYFVLNKTWKSKYTIEFQLQMDVLNTFKWNDSDLGYEVSPKTLVTREHKDRITQEDGTIYRRLIDLKSEGINPPLYKIKEELIVNDNLQWCLYYRSSENDNDVVDCFLVPSQTISARTMTNTGEITPSDLTDGHFYQVDYHFNGGTEEGGTPVITDGGNGYITHYNNGYTYSYQFKRVGSSITIWAVMYWGSTYTKYNEVTGVSSLRFNLPEVEVYESASEITSKTSTPNLTINTSASVQQHQIYDVTTINRTDKKNIKIIRLPYSPSYFPLDNNGIYDVGGEWEYDSVTHFLKLRDLQTKFNNTFRPNDIKPFEDLQVTISTINVNAPRNDALESKIYHSDYFYPKFVYDSFTLEFRYELIDNYVIDHQSTDHFEFSFIVSRNIVSKFLFMFPQYVLTYSNQDYDNVVCVSRNNEEVLYNSEYINYIKTGYNYDLKAKERNEAAAGAGLGISIGSTLLGIIGGVASGNYAVAGLSAVAGGLSIANQSIQYAKTRAESEANLSRRLEEKKLQGVSVLNADDIDLLEAYSGNKAKICYYQVSPTMKDALLDMFYYSGYIAHEQKVPAINTRYWFNFLQCDLVINATCNMPDEIESKIKEKFKEGVTFFHYHSTYDFEQIKENYEVSILS